MSDPSDSELMALTRAGDRNAFSMIVDRYKHSVVGYLARMTGSRERADDLAQETFVRLFTKGPLNGVAGNLGPWLYRVATNLVRSEERRARRFRLFSLAFAAHRSVGMEAARAQEDRLLRDEAARQVSAALAELPLAFRTVVVLREIQGLSYEEIAEITSTPVGTVRSRISRGRMLLRQLLASRRNGAGA